MNDFFIIVTIFRATVNHTTLWDIALYVFVLFILPFFISLFELPIPLLTEALS